jgi:hypothetical protein
MNGITVLNADEIYGENINSTGSITINGNSLSTLYVDVSSNQLINGTKTFIGELISTRNINSTTTAIGSGALRYRQSSSISNIGIGTNAIQGNSTTPALNTGSNLIGIGENVLKIAPDISNCIGIGNNVLAASTDGTRVYNNIAIGNNSMNDVTGVGGNCYANDNVLIGHNTGQKLGKFAWSWFNVGIGNNCFQNTIYTEKAVAVGYGATTGNGGVAVGYLALGNAPTGQETLAMGKQAGQFNAGVANTFIGVFAGASSINIQQYQNTFIGCQADLASSGLIARNSTAIGFNSRVIQTNSFILGGGSDFGIPEVVLPAKNRIYTCSTLSAASNAMLKQWWYDLGHAYGDTILLTSTVSSITLPQATRITQNNMEQPAGVATSIGQRYTFVKNYVSPLTSVTITPYNATYERILDINSGTMLSSITMGTNIRSLSLVRIDVEVNPTATYIAWICYSRDIDTTVFPQLTLNNTFSGTNTFTNPIIEGSYPRKGSTVLDNSVAGQKTYTISTSNWTETYVLQAKSTTTNEMFNITLPTITPSILGAQIIISYNPWYVTRTKNQYTTLNGDMYFPEINPDNIQSTTQAFWAVVPASSQPNPIYYTIYFTAVSGSLGGGNNSYWLATHSTYRNYMTNTWDYKQIFLTLPECTETPTTNSQLANKQYVDTKVATLSTAALLDVANTFTAQNIFNSFCPQTDTDPSGNNDLVRKSWVDNNLVALTGGQTIYGTKVFVKAIVCNDDPINGDELTRKSWVDTQLATKSGLNVSNNFTALNTFTASVKIGSGGYTPPSNCLFIGQHNSYRKIILHSVNDNEFQNYSIGTNVVNNEMVFMIPGVTRTFKFCNASGTTSKNDLFTLGLNSAANLSVELTLPSMVLSSSGNRYGGWNTTALDLSGCLLQVEQMNVANASTGTITGATTISKPFNQYHAVEATGTAFTITLPEITSKEMGKEIVFRKVKQTGTLVSISFIGNGTQKVYNTALTGGATAQALMTSSVYIVRLVALLDATTGGGVYAWFQV